jgi:SPP1 Gp6-like portal protein
MLDKIAAILMAKGLVSSTWQSEMTLRGELVALFRQYYEGQHRLKLTSEMRKMMQITDERLDRYNANYCGMVVSQMADRLTVDTIEAIEPSPSNATLNPSATGISVGHPSTERGENAAQQWVDDLLKANRFDGLQIDVREAALRDGITFVLSEFDDDLQRVCLYHELAWDGDCGTMVVYDRQGREIVAGVKVWYEGEYRRANIYYRNSLERYTYELVQIDEGGQKSEEYQLKLMSNPEDTTRDGVEPGVPIIPFFNKSKKGSSELVDVIPLQDSLNSTLISAVMNALLTAFSILFAKGFKPPSGITPGMIIHAMIDDGNGNPYSSESKDAAEAVAALMDTYDLVRIQPGEVEPLIKQCEFIIKQIGTVSLTPVPGLMGGDSQSGEALQERRIGQLGKVNAAQVRLGNSWENVIELSHTQQEVFGKTMPPESAGWNCRWKSAEIRNDVNILKAAELLQKWGFTREALRRLSQLPGVNYSEDDITRLMDEQAADAGRALAGAVGNVPEFGAFNFA